MNQFAVGDLVVFKTAMLEGRHGTHVPRIHQIVSRFSETCSGGTQLLYVLGSGKRGEWIHEDELQMYDEGKHNEVLQAGEDARRLTIAWRKVAKSVTTEE